LKLGITGGSAIKSTATSSKPFIASTRLHNNRTIRPAAGTEERKRSQRVLLRVRTNVHVAVKGKPTTLEASTVCVNPQGALVVLQESLPADTRLILEHRGTREKVACRVPKPGKEMPEGFHVPVEFDSPAPGFWKIDFPPVDWRPDEL
jgi:hypothetical protein